MNKYLGYIITTIILLFIAASLYVLKYHPYDAGDKIGYNLGLAGGLGMLSLYLYPLRKRVSWLDWSGSLPKWFNVHVIIGVTAPLLVILHTGFRAGAMNSIAALAATIIVLISGLVGRFLLRRVEHPTYQKLFGM